MAHEEAERVGALLAPAVWPPPHTYQEVRQIATDVLPGVGWQQFPLWRYALTWRRP